MSYVCVSEMVVMAHDTGRSNGYSTFVKKHRSFAPSESL